MSASLTLIVAVTRNGVIGRNGDMPFHIPTDLRHFKASTMGHPLVMGRRTFDSLSGGALPGRRNIVVTRNPEWSATGAERASSLEDAVAMCGADEELMVCGGGEIYRQAMPFADRLIVTEIDATVDDGDTFFPEIDPAEWNVAASEGPVVDSRSGLSLRFVTYSRHRKQ